MEDREVKQVVCEELCVTKLYVKDGVAKKDGAQRPTRPSLALLHEAHERHHCGCNRLYSDLHTQVSHANVTSIAKSPMSPKS